MSALPIDQDFIAQDNAARASAHEEDYDALARKLRRRDIDIEAITTRVADFGVAIPSWGVGTGGTRFARFPGLGEPRDIHDKLRDCAVIAQLSRATPRVSLHFPWDRVADPVGLKQEAKSLGLGFDAVNSNTFQDQDGQALSYKFGSLSHVDSAVRAQAVAHNADCIRLGDALGSRAICIWIGDGSNFPGQSNFARTFERYIESVGEIVAGLPDGWQVYIEHKMYEPAFYSTVLQDWGSSLLAAQALGPKVSCLVDLGHHAQGVNIEMIVARLIYARKLGGFHFNDAKYGDDDLDAGSIDPFRLFLIFNELVDAEANGAPARPFAHMLDQSHNVTDPIESLMTSAAEVQRAYAQALLVDRPALEQHQHANDAMLAAQTLKGAYITDVAPILAEARRRQDGAIDPVAVYRASHYRARVAQERPNVGGRGGGIV